MARKKDTARDDALGTVFRTIVSAQGEADELHPTAVRILEAASSLFAERGYAAATTKELAHRAGVTEKTVFAHYGSKTELFLAAMGPALSGFMGTTVFKELALELAKDGPARERLRAVARNRMKFAAEHTELMKTVAQELLLSPHFRGELRTYFTQSILPHARALLSRAIASGDLRRMPVDRMLRMCISAMVGYVMTRHVLAPELDWDDDAEVDGTLDALFEGIVAKPL